MDLDAHKVRSLSFGSVAEAYERARPEYPPAAVAWLAGEPPRDVVDLGAGTGKLTRQLAAAGHRVVAVEPLPEMRAEFERVIAGVRALAGTGEEMPLPDGSADVVTAAQAFHWFDHGLALREIARVLRPGGSIALVWNIRDDREPWVAQLSEEAIGNEGFEERDAAAPVAQSGLFEAVERALFPHSQQVDREGLVELVLSRSYCAVLTPEERAPVLERVERVFEEHAVEGMLELPYVTECFRAVRR